MPRPLSAAPVTLRRSTLHGPIRSEHSRRVSPERPIRCAIYTRVSVAEYGADPDLSSCALQYAACAKYIEQKHSEEWQHVNERFEDDGESGANTARPARSPSLRAHFRHRSTASRCSASIALHGA